MKEDRWLIVKAFFIVLGLCLLSAVVAIAISFYELVEAFNGIHD